MKKISMKHEEANAAVIRTEAELSRRVKRYLEPEAYVIRIENDKRLNAGLPDLRVLYAGNKYDIELKVGKTRVSARGPYKGRSVIDLSHWRDSQNRHRLIEEKYGTLETLGLLILTTGAEYRLYYISGPNLGGLWEAKKTGPVPLELLEPFKACDLHVDFSDRDMSSNFKKMLGFL